MRQYQTGKDLEQSCRSVPGYVTAHGRVTGRIFGDSKYAYLSFASQRQQVQKQGAPCLPLPHNQQQLEARSVAAAAAGRGLQTVTEWMRESPSPLDGGGGRSC